MGVARVERVAAPGVVDVRARVRDPVVVRVVDAAEGQRRPALVALGGVVVDDVEEHLDAGRVQRADHGLELPDLLTAGTTGAVARMGGEVAHRVVAPVVLHAAPEHVRLGDEVVHRHQLDRGDAEPDQVLDGCGVREAGVGPSQLRRDVGVGRRESLHVQLVDDRVGPVVAREVVLAPRERVVHDHRARHERRAVAVVLRPVGLPEDGVVEREGVVDGACVGVEEQLARVEALAPRRVIGPVDPEAVALPRSDLRQVPVPHVVRRLLERHPGLVARLVEQAHVHGLGGLAEEGDVGALAVPVGAER